MRVETPGHVLIEDLPAVPEPSDQPAEKDPGEPTPEQGELAATSPHGDSAVKVPPRPAIDVALESVRLHRDKHIAPLVARIRKWDMRKLDFFVPGGGDQLREALDSLEGSLSNLFDLLAVMQASGFVAKTTEATRTRAKIENGASVQLVLHKWNELFPVYGAERLNSRLTCSQVTDTHAVITTEDGTCLGAIRMTHLRVRPVKQEME